MEQEEQISTFFLTSIVAAVVDAIIVSSTSLKPQVQIVSLVIFCDFALAIAALAYGSHAAAIAGIAIAILGALWSVGSLLYFAAQRRAAQGQLRDRVEELSYLAGSLRGLSSADHQLKADDETKVRDRWRIIQNYLDALQRVGGADRSSTRR